MQPKSVLNSGRSEFNCFLGDDGSLDSIDDIHPSYPEIAFDSNVSLLCNCLTAHAVILWLFSSFIHRLRVVKSREENDGLISSFLSEIAY